MTQDLQLRVDPRTACTLSLLIHRCANETGIDPGRIRHLRILKRSIDARQRDIYINLTVRLYIDEDAPQLDYEPIAYPHVDNCPEVIVVGAGPGGLFAALRLIELQLRPIVLERGKDVHARRKDIARISTQHIINDESNYSFGEGGAGAYSDGKLYTRSVKRGNVDKILQVFCQHGASTDILADAHPHIGTDRLPQVIEAMRHTIQDHGGEVHFETRVDSLLLDSEGVVRGVTTADQRQWQGPVILATGHSARDVYRFLHTQGITEEIKSLAIGVRLEHPATLIDQIMYHNRQGRGAYLPAAEYRMTAQVDGRGVYSFCMCPGGFVIPAASGQRQIVVNGMSPSGRNSRWSNSGMVVETRAEDLDDPFIRQLLSRAMQDADFAQRNSDIDDPQSPLRMMYFQEALEQECWLQGGRRQTAPAQRMTDFVNGRLSDRLPVSSYTPGVIASPLHFWMPRFLTSRLQQGFKTFGHRYHGFLTQEALMLAVETRTSSPVRITRDRYTLQHVTARGLFPCGEGAGSAGGIVSAAIDGERCAEAVSAYLAS